MDRSSESKRPSKPILPRMTPPMTAADVVAGAHLSTAR